MRCPAVPDRPLTLQLGEALPFPARVTRGLAGWVGGGECLLKKGIRGKVLVSSLTGDWSECTCKVIKSYGI